MFQQKYYKPNCEDLLEYLRTKDVYFINLQIYRYSLNSLSFIMLKGRLKAFYIQFIMNIHIYRYIFMINTIVQ